MSKAEGDMFLEWQVSTLTGKQQGKQWVNNGNFVGTARAYPPALRAPLMSLSPSYSNSGGSSAIMGC